MDNELPWPKAPLPWQSDYWAQLVQAQQQNSFPHALLLCGTQAIGKLHLARSLACFLLCSAPRSGTACGECRSCHFLEVGSHADFLALAPEEGSRVIKINQVRELIHFTNRTPSLGTHKVIVLAPAESLNVNAANALLKCLEEPADNTHLILVSHRPSALPATVRSRCQVLALGNPGRGECLPWLDTITGNGDISKDLLDACGNKPLAAQSMFLADGLETQQMLNQSMQALAQGTLSAVDFPPLVKDLELAGVLGLYLDYLQREIRRLSLTGQTPGRAAFDLLDDLSRLRAAVSRGGNPNRQLTIEDMACRLSQVLSS
jgi:DNA polymerase-3 subunit delta'